jgi:signal transduction histidine kinase
MRHPLMMNAWRERWLTLWRAWAAPPTDLPGTAGRMRLVERDIGLPVKAGVLLTVGWFLYFSLNVEALAYSSEVALELVRALQQIFVMYAIVSAFLALPIWAFDALPLRANIWLTFTTALLDALFFASLTLVTDGFDSILFWTFPLLMARNALSITVAGLQIVLNLFTVAAYVAAGVLDLWVLQLDEAVEYREVTEPFLIRVVLLLLLAAIYHGLMVLFERERQREAEAAEFGLRQQQMQAAGRLAAEIAHQIKNPLGIINNAAFAVQRTLGDSSPPAAQRQLQIIRTEVERSDRIITELIGFAQLAEGHIERLQVEGELEAAIERVLPPGGAFEIQVVREYVPPLPVLLFSRRALAEVLDNLLKNARDVLQGHGTIRIGARAEPGLGIQITIADDGPGIPEECLERIFEAYFTTKPGGTGLGLAIVKQNVEMFGGHVRVESGTGQGTCFRLFFPGRTTLRLGKH